MKRISKTEIKEMRSQSKKNRIMFAFTLPTVILYTIFFLVTMLIGVYYSFTDWNGISKDYTFVGLKNYVKVLTDERFREALWFNIGYTIALVVLLIVIPLTIALALNRIRRLSTLFRSIYFIPAVISMVTVGLIWNELFYRAVPAIGEMLNIEALSTSPLGNPKLAAIAIMVVNIWQGCAIPTVLFIAGLQSVPKDLLEAATIDGAGNWARFWNVIIPYLIPVLNMVIITQAKAGLTVFDYIKVMTNGGPAQSTEAVNDLIEQEQFDTSVYPESLLTPLRYEGELYALPQEVSPFVIYYNKEMFEAANVPLPTDDWTIDEFYAAAEALTDPAEKVYGYRHPGAWADQVLGWLSRAGVDFDISGKEVKGLDTPEALNALTFLYDLVVKDELSPNPAALTAMGKGADAMFRNQKVAMESAGLWMLPTYKENPLPFEWDVVRMPMDKNQNTKAGILNWGISKSTKNPEAAWDLLKFLCGPEGNRIVAESNMALPGSTDKEALQIVLDSKFPSNVKAFVDSVPDCDLKDQLSIYRTEVNTKVQQLVDEMLIGKSTPEETQEKLIKEINAILAN